MGIWNKLRGELIDIVQWIDDTNDTMVYRFERYNNQIKYGARLTVREGQTAVFVNEGKIADVFVPGMYTLETKNLPVLSTLQGWKYGFNSPFMAEVYFCSMRQFTDLKWGTMNPIMMRDAEFGPVRLRAYGTYAVKVSEPGVLIREIVGTDGHFTVDEIVNQLRNLIVSRFAEIAGSSGIPVLDMAANYGSLGDFLAQKIAPEFQGYGLELAKLLVENISLPPKSRKRSTSAPAWGWWETWRPTPSSTSPIRSPTRPKIPAGWPRPGPGSAWGWQWPGRSGRRSAPGRSRRRPEVRRPLSPRPPGSWRWRGSRPARSTWGRSPPRRPRGA